ncbi:MAG: MFS transporter [Humibacter sp.]
MLVAYALVARRARHPVVDLRLVRTRTGWLSLLLCGMATVVTYVTVFLLPVFAQQVQGASALEAGWAMLPQGILTGLSMGLGARLLRWWSIRWTVIAGFGLLAVAGTGVLFIQASTPLWLISLVLACRAAALGLVVTPLLTAMLEPLPEHALPDANSLFSIWQRVIGSFGIGLLASLYATTADVAGPVPALHEVGAVLVVVCVVAALGAIALPGARLPGLSHDRAVEKPPSPAGP